MEFQVCCEFRWLEKQKIWQLLMYFHHNAERSASIKSGSHSRVPHVLAVRHAYPPPPILKLNFYFMNRE